MKIILKTNLPDNLETRIDLISIIKYAFVQYDIPLEIVEYADLPKTAIAAMNNVTLQEIIKGQQNESS